MIRPLLTAAICLSAFQSVAQALDSLLLDEIEVYGAPISKYAVGSKVILLEKNEVSTLNRLIGDQLPVYFKTYGNGQLATVAFRGTSASHTAVLWNGIPVNSPTLGQTDFSLWPSFLVDDIAVQFGSSASLYGSGAIGGSVLLESAKPLIDDKQEIKVLSQLGSFGQYTNGLSAAYANGHVTGQTKLFHHYIRNDFSYPLKGSDDVVLKQNNARVRQYGVSQDIYFDRQDVAFHAQLLKNDREIQPSITNPTGNDQLQDTNLRLAVNQDAQLGQGSLSSTVAYIINDQYFNKDSRVVSQQFSGVANYELALTGSSSVRIGTNLNHFVAKTENFYETDWLTDLFAAFAFQPTNHWKVSLNLRQSLDHNVRPFAPGLGTEYKIWETIKNQLIWSAQISRAYRLPTLNDRFWQPGGNPNLQAEESLNLETGLNGTYKQEGLNISYGLTAFRNWVDEWIIWLPDESSVWSPDNIRNVRVSGLELTSSVSYSLAGHTFDLTGNYSFTESINESGLTTNDNSKGKQLPYVPKDQLNVGIGWMHQTWQADINNNFTGERYTTDDNTAFNRVDGFNLLDLRVGKVINLNSISINASIESRNIMDVYYENLINRAMPGRSYLFTLLFKI